MPTRSQIKDTVVPSQPAVKDPFVDGPTRAEEDHIEEGDSHVSIYENANSTHDYWIFRKQVRRSQKHQSINALLELSLPLARTRYTTMFIGKIIIGLVVAWRQRKTCFSAGEKEACKNE